MDSAIGVLRIMPASKSEVGRFSTQIIEAVKSGDVSPLEVLVLLRALENVSETVRTAIKDNINTAADKYSEKSFNVFNARIEKAEIGTKYFYEASGDPEWAKRKFNVEAATNLLKEREAFLRALKDPMDILDSETGEVFKVVPPPKASTSGLKVFL